MPDNFLLDMTTLYFFVKSIVLHNYFKFFLYSWLAVILLVNDFRRHSMTTDIMSFPNILIFNSWKILVHIMINSTCSHEIDYYLQRMQKLFVDNQSSRRVFFTSFESWRTLPLLYFSCLLKTEIKTIFQNEMILT